MSQDMLDRTIVDLYRMKQILVGKDGGGDFKLFSGRKAPLYVRFRGIGVKPEVSSAVTELYVSILASIKGDFDFIAGVPQAGTPLAERAGEVGGFPTLTLRTEPKEHGTQDRLVMGDYECGSRLCLIDNAANSGGSLLKWIDLLTAEGLCVTDVVVFTDWDEGAFAALAARNVRLHSLTTLRGVVETLRAKKELDEWHYELALSYLNDPNGYQLYDAAA